MTRLSRPLRSPAGFTLMEMLAVILILAILLALVVGVSRYIIDKAAESETQAIQSIVIDAVILYKSKTGVLPADDGSCAVLMTKLAEVPECRKKVGELPPKAWSKSGSPLNDGWHRAMRFQQSGGIGGAPVLISAGSDGGFGTADDIRSDR